MSALIYALWDDETGNLVGDYLSAEEAYADVRDTVARYGRSSAECRSMVLLTTDEHEIVERVAGGAELIALAERAVARISYIGVGLYTMRDAARIIRSTPDELRRWLKRERYQSHGKTYRRKPFVTRLLPLESDAVTLSELLELRAIRELRRRGITMARIRSLSAKLSEAWDVDFPFSSRRFAEEVQIAGTNVFSRPSGGTLRELASGQLAMLELVAPLLEDVDFSAEGTALQFWPLTKKARVVLDAQRQFGQPIDAPTGVPTSVLYEATRANPNDTPAAIARWYDVDVAAVNDAVAFESTRAA